MSSDPNCVPELRVSPNGVPKPGACVDSRTGGPGYRNLEGFPPCCDLYSSSDGSSSWLTARTTAAPRSTPSYAPASQPDSSRVYSLSQAAAGCVAKNPNYPSLAGSCVYNPLNPCIGNYETTDTRFGTKMCCAPRTAANAACYPPETFKSTFGKSNFGLGGTNMLLILLFVVFIYFIGKKYKLF